MTSIHVREVNSSKNESQIWLEVVKEKVNDFKSPFSDELKEGLGSGLDMSLEFRRSIPISWSPISAQPWLQVAFLDDIKEGLWSGAVQVFGHESEARAEDWTFFT